MLRAADDMHQWPLLLNMQKVDGLNAFLFVIFFFLPLAYSEEKTTGSSQLMDAVPDILHALRQTEPTRTGILRSPRVSSEELQGKRAKARAHECLHSCVGATT